MPLPRVGITAYRVDARYGAWRKEAAVVPQEYIDFVTAADGVPVIVPAMEADAQTVVDGLDALILTGGPDVAPHLYHQDQQAPFEGNDPVRDEWEMRLLGVTLMRQLPVLAICRGMQLLNVAFGGTLHQHLPDVVLDDRHRTSVGTFTTNSVTTVPGTTVESIVGAELQVPCHHHQAVSDIGPGLVAAARATDGVVEAVEAAGRPFVIGVQWHPEESDDVSLARALVNAARIDDVERCGA